jgi:uncharacterized OB-fold protein
MSEARERLEESTDTEVRRSLPVIEPGSSAYWEGARDHQLVIQRCNDCSFYVHPPRPTCPRCQGESLKGQALSGTGIVYSYSIMHYPGNPGFDELPYAVVIVELSEQAGLRTVGNLLGVAPEEVEIGMPVVVDYEELTPEITLPQWRARR